jgi:hypothetical protein
MKKRLNRDGKKIKLPKKLSQMPEKLHRYYDDILVTDTDTNTKCSID